MQFYTSQLVQSTRLTPIPAQLSSCFSLMVPFKLDLLTPQTSSLLRHSKLVTCSCFQKDLYTINTIVMQRILQQLFLHFEVQMLDLCQSLILCSPPELIMGSWQSLSRLILPPFRRLKLGLHLRPEVTDPCYLLKNHYLISLCSILSIVNEYSLIRPLMMG